MSDESAINTFSLYQKFINFRKNSSFLYNSDQIFNYNTNNKNISSMKLRYGKKDYLIFANFSDKNQLEKIKFPSYVSHSKVIPNKKINQRDIFFNGLIEEEKGASIYNIIGDYSYNLNYSTSGFWPIGAKIIDAITINSHSIIMIEFNKYD